MTSRTGLSEEQYAAALSRVRRYLTGGLSITNAKLRALTALNYDQAIKFFNLAVERGELERRGRASGTNYVLPVNREEEG